MFQAAVDNVILQFVLDKQFNINVKHDMLECLLAIVKLHVDSKLGKDVVLESLLISQLDEENPQYLSFGIPDAAID
jgi:hypothetical protein